MTKRPVVISLALTGQLKAALQSDAMPDLSSGSCIGMDTNLFFSEKKGDVLKAKAICATCPVISSCAAWGAGNAEYGIFGGLTAKERAKTFGKKTNADAAEVAEELRFLLTGTLDSISMKYAVDQRTVLRWRGILKDFDLAA